NGNVTQYDAYLPYGELLVDEHSSSEDMPYKFNGKEFDEETGLYYYGARYMDPTTGIWYGADAFVEAKPQYASYLYCEGNPINLTDPDGNWERNASGNLVAQRGDNAVSYAKYTGMSNAQALAVFKANGVVPDENNILNLKVGQEISNGSYYLGDITVLGTRGISVNKNKSSNRYDVSLLHTSAKGVEFVKDREGLTGKENGYVYDDPKGFATFGVGHLLHRSGYTRSDVNYWTNRLKGNRNLINDVLKQDLKSTEATVKRLVKVPLAQNEFDAIVSFTFNVGPKGLQKSQFLKSLNKGVYNGNLMLRYLRPRKLKDRREKEVALFNHGKYN
ncbi:MAG: RHS repeat-associated core domain-containing protein, partial [Prevotella sp.]|nr:RHS repeat-associated core domain-containing protein [Prevotella sp.]